MDGEKKPPKMVARLLDESVVRSSRHGIYQWEDLPIGTHFRNRLKHDNWEAKRANHHFAGVLLVEADPPAPDLTVTLPAEQVNLILERRWWSMDWAKLASIIRAAKDAQEA